MTDQTLQPLASHGPPASRHHVECITEFAKATFGDLGDTELLRQLRDLRDEWDAGSLRLGSARRLALLVLERARRLADRSEGGAA